MSGVVASSGSARMKQPPWLMPTASGPLRWSSHCRPSLRLAEPRVELVVGGRPRRLVGERGSAGGPAGSRRHRASRARPEFRASRAAPPARCPTAAEAAATGSRRPRRAPRRVPSRSASCRPGASARRRRACRRASMPVGERLGLDLQVAAPARRVEIGRGGADAPSFRRRELEVAGAFLRRAVEVVGRRHADLARACDERIDQRMARADVGDLERPVAAVERARAALVAFGLDEVGQARRRSPSRGCRARPSGRSPRAGRGCRSGR